MVKKTSGTTERGKIKVRFFELEVEGGSEALQDSVRTLAAALQRPATSVTPRTIAGNLSAPAPVEGESEEPIGEEDSQPVQEDDAAARSIRQRAKRTPPTPKILDDVGFEEGTPTWVDFAKSKSPDSDVLKVAVVAVWFKRFKKVDSIGIDHAYTAFRFVDWATPDDIGQSFRNAKRQKNWFSQDETGLWVINIVGINAVDKIKQA